MRTKIIELTEIQRTRFDKCWNVYARKVNKGEAEIAWGQIDPDDKLTETIYDSILAQNRDRGTKFISKEDKKFIKHFSSWLRAKGWVYENDSDGEHATEKSGTPCQCGKDGKVHVAGKYYCTPCYDSKAHPNFKRQVYDDLCKRGMGKLKTETREEWLARIKNWGRQVIAKKYGKTFSDET